MRKKKSGYKVGQKMTFLDGNNEPYIYIYMILNKANGKFYIGQSTDPIRRANNHVRSGMIKRLGETPWEIKILDKSENLRSIINHKQMLQARKVVFALEQYWIKKMSFKFPRKCVNEQSNDINRSKRNWMEKARRDGNLEYSRGAWRKKDLFKK
jgi:predicted GIY-YIG superfamily endonuclease